jgi:hypothetical protein
MSDLPREPHVTKPNFFSTSFIPLQPVGFPNAANPPVHPYPNPPHSWSTKTSQNTLQNTA